jgi:cyclophilin family peptidyl-prolyl cis-trans isomerase
MEEAINVAAAPIQYAYFDVVHYPGSNRPPRDLGRLHMALYSSLAPMTCKNFRTICSGHFPLKQQHLNPFTRRPITHYTYSNTVIHRVIPGFMVQGGDITHMNGTGPSPSIYGGFFKDETFKIKFNRPYLLAMANTGAKNTNGSQWFITTAPAPHLNNTHVAFGEVFDSHSKLIIKDMESLGSQNGTITQGNIVIKNCGMVDPLLGEELAKIHLEHGMCDIMVGDLYGRILKDRFGDTELYNINKGLAANLEGDYSAAHRQADLKQTQYRGFLEGKWGSRDESRVD